jgi:hypothetical protein
MNRTSASHPRVVDRLRLGAIHGHTIRSNQHESSPAATTAGNNLLKIWPALGTFTPTAGVDLTATGHCVRGVVVCVTVTPLVATNDGSLQFRNAGAEVDF